MKNFKYIVALIIFLATNTIVKGQLPLLEGDAVYTHSPLQYNNGFTTTGVVLKVLKTSQTSSLTLGAINGANSSYVDTRWTATNLGKIFGITLDHGISGSNPNIYVSSTQIYGGIPNCNRKIWRLDGVTGDPSLVFDFNNPSGTGSNVSDYSLGNLKFGKFGNTEVIFVSDFETGTIQRLTGNSNSNALWTIQPSFDPKFNDPNNSSNELAYGIAIRKMGSNYRLYYAKILKNNLAFGNSLGTNEIYCVDLNANGDFLPATEALVPILVPFSSTQVISDISFSSNGLKMLVGQQSWGCSNLLCMSMSAHESQVCLLESNSSTSNNFAIEKYFEAGANLGTGYTPGANCVGGVSFSNNVIQTDNTIYCDTSVYMTADQIGSGNHGVQGTSISNNGIANSILFEPDDILSNSLGKGRLGDVEVYKKTICPSTPSCNCGSWNHVANNGDTTWWSPSPNTSPENQPRPVISFEQGLAPPLVLSPSYKCQGECNATFTYTLRNPKDNSTFNLYGSSSLDFNYQRNKKDLNLLPCGLYEIIITPICGNDTCEPMIISINIPCRPPCFNCTGTATVNVTNEARFKDDNKIAIDFAISNSIPVQEVRVLVDEFRVSSTNGNDNCILCKNPPRTWGSIERAILSGTTSNPLILHSALDNREAIFKNPPYFNLNGNALALLLNLPNDTDLPCCHLKFEFCIKIIIRDINCCEKEILKCFTLTQSGNH